MRKGYTESGSARVAVPEQFAAQLETDTVNGSIHTDFPVTVQGRVSRRLSLPLNGGGKTIRALTTNGTRRSAALTSESRDEGSSSAP